MDTKRVVSDIPVELYEKLKKLADEHNRSISSMIARLVSLSTGSARPEPIQPVETQVRMPASPAEREAALERIR